MRRPSTYRFFGPRWARVAIGAHAFALVGLVIAFIPTIRSQEPDAWVFAFMFVGFGFICWSNLFLEAYEIRLEDGVVRWRAPLRSGALPLQSIRSIRNVVPSWPWPLVRIGGSGGPSVFIPGTKELRAFVDDLASERIGIDVDQRSYRSWRYGTWPRLR